MSKKNQFREPPVVIMGRFTNFTNMHEIANLLLPLTFAMNKLETQSFSSRPEIRNNNSKFKKKTERKKIVPLITTVVPKTFILDTLCVMDFFYQWLYTTTIIYYIFIYYIIYYYIIIHILYCGKNL